MSVCDQQYILIGDSTWHPLRTSQCMHEMFGDVILMRHGILLGLQRPNTDRPCRLDRFRHLLSKTTEMGKPNSRTTRQHEPPPRYHGEQKSLRVLLRFVLRRPVLLTEASAEEP